ncbi:MAG: prenyltransferase/squalene oxidase repeat-containing protein [Candidatus Hodarchaeota archaeon]
MTWIPLLLTDPSPNLRLLVLKELLNRPEDDREIRELLYLREKDPIVESLIKTQLADGSWSSVDFDSRKSTAGNLQTTSQALVRLGYLGFEKDHIIVKKAAEYIFSKQEDDDSWPILTSKIGSFEEIRSYDMIPLQVATPLEGLAACGYSTDNRAEKAYDWLMEHQLDDGAWPTGTASGVYGGVAGYRRLPHSRWGCRSSTIAVLNCLAYHSKRRKSSKARRALDLILGCETKQKNLLGFIISRLIGLEESRGWRTYYPKMDAAHILSLCWKIGASLDDERILELVQFVKEEKGEYGLWECSLHPQASRWLTFDLLRSLSNLEESTDWISTEPRTPFQEYPKKMRRF